MQNLREIPQKFKEKKEKDLERVRQAARTDITKIAFDFPKIWEGSSKRSIDVYFTLYNNERLKFPSLDILFQ